MVNTQEVLKNLSRSSLYFLGFTNSKANKANLTLITLSLFSSVLFAFSLLSIHLMTYHSRQFNNKDLKNCDQLKEESHISVATKLQRFLSEDPSSVHFQIPKNLQSFEDFRPKIAKIFWENLTIFWTKLSVKVQKYVLFLKLWTPIFPHNVKFYCWEN